MNARDSQSGDRETPIIVSRRAEMLALDYFNVNLERFVDWEETVLWSTCKSAANVALYNVTYAPRVMRRVAMLVDPASIEMSDVDRLAAELAEATIH